MKEFMKNVNIDVNFTKKGCAYVIAYYAVFYDRDGNFQNGHMYFDEKRVALDIKCSTEVLCYKYLYTSSVIIFL